MNEQRILQPHLPRAIELARYNINITNFNKIGDKLYVNFEYQWRDPRNNAYRWVRSFITLPSDSSNNTVCEQVKETVIAARKSLEGGSHGRQ